MSYTDLYRAVTDQRRNDRMEAARLHRVIRDRRTNLSRGPTP